MRNIVQRCGRAGLLLWCACQPSAIDTRAFGKDCYPAPAEGRVQAFFADGVAVPERCQTPRERIESEAAESAAARGALERGRDAGAATVATAATAAAVADAGRAGEPSSSVKPFSDGCSEARVRALFARSFEQGGCQDPGFAGCHGTDPDDTAPNLLALDLRAELVGRRIAAPPEGIHECNQELVARGGRELSLLWQKAAGEPPCGDAMPPDEVARAPASELACLGEWIDRLAAGD